MRGSNIEAAANRHHLSFDPATSSRGRSKIAVEDKHDCFRGNIGRMFRHFAPTLNIDLTGDSADKMLATKIARASTKALTISSVQAKAKRRH